MSTDDHSGIVMLLARHFEVHNQGFPISARPIIVSGNTCKKTYFSSRQPVHRFIVYNQCLAFPLFTFSSPNGDETKIAPDIAIFPSQKYIPDPEVHHLGPPPSTTNVS